MKAKEIFLLIFIIIAGITFYFIQTDKLHIDFSSDSFWLTSLEEFKYDETRTIAPPFPSKILLDNQHGNINIQGTDQKNITISLNKAIWRKNKELADEASKKIDFMSSKKSDHIEIATIDNDLERRYIRTHYNIDVPHGMEAEIRNSFGTVTVSNLGRTEIVNNHGEIDVSDISGKLDIQNSYKKVNIENVSSDCEITSKYASIDISGVEGEVNVKNKYGEIHLDNISKKVKAEGIYCRIMGQNLPSPLNVENSYKKISLINIGPLTLKGHYSEIELDKTKGPCKIENKYGKIKINNLKGNLDIKGKSLKILAKDIISDEIFISSSYKDIEIVDFSGQTKISNSHGDITLKPYPLTHSINVEGTYSDLVFHWPDDFKYPFEARVKTGNIKWKLPYESSFQKENSISILKAFQEEKGKPEIYLYTSYNSIWISR
ncbi:MAG: hypothetical protein ACOC5F_02395 [Candidatus Aminicenantaceae bacterium]